MLEESKPISPELQFVVLAVGEVDKFFLQFRCQVEGGLHSQRSEYIGLSAYGIDYLVLDGKVGFPYRYSSKGRPVAFSTTKPSTSELHPYTPVS